MNPMLENVDSCLENGCDGYAGDASGNPLQFRGTVAKNARKYMSDRSRILSAGIVAVVWGVLVGEVATPLWAPS